MSRGAQTKSTKYSGSTYCCLDIRLSALELFYKSILPSILSAGETFCLGIFINNTKTWDSSSDYCDHQYNSDLLNVRQLEKFGEQDSAIKNQILSDIHRISKSQYH